MSRPPSKKAKSATDTANEDSLGPIIDLVESDSDKDSDPVQAENEDDETDSSDSHSDEDIVPSAPRSPPPTVMKRKRGRKSKPAVVDNISRSYSLPLPSYAHNTIVDEASSTKLTYLVSILSAEEASKPVSKRMPICVSLELGDKEPWDTIKAQLLMKIDAALSPLVLNFDDYIVMFHISRILPKPGMVLCTEENYAALLLRAANLTSKTPTINVTIQEKKKELNKENEGMPSTTEAKNGAKAAKKVCFYCFATLAYMRWFKLFNRRKSQLSSQEM
jgi:hypothetical protein